MIIISLEIVAAEAQIRWCNNVYEGKIFLKIVSLVYFMVSEINICNKISLDNMLYFHN